MGQQNITFFDDLVFNSLVAEDGIGKTSMKKSMTQEKKKGKNHEQLKPKGSPQKGNQPKSLRTYPTCKNCGKSHLGECMRGSGNCYRCGQSGHVMSDCANRKKKKVALKPLQPPKVGSIMLMEGKCSIMLI